MEFLRYGSRIPGKYEYGCCAVDIIQDFSQNPDEKSSIEVVSGDNGQPLLNYEGKPQFLGSTYRDIFNQRLRIGTFSSSDMPNHVFFAVLTQDQLRLDTGRQWLKILKESGFEFVRTTDNSVYTGESLYDEEPYDEYDEYDEYDNEPHLNYIFALYRNIGRARVKNPFNPPAEWTDLDDVTNGNIDEIYGHLTREQWLALEENRYTKHREVWDKIGPVPLYTREQLEDSKIPIILAGKFSQNPQEEASIRERRDNVKKDIHENPKKAAKAVWFV